MKLKRTWALPESVLTKWDKIVVFWSLMSKGSWRVLPLYNVATTYKIRASERCIFPQNWFRRPILLTNTLQCSFIFRPFRMRYVSKTHIIRRPHPSWQRRPWDLLAGQINIVTHQSHAGIEWDVKQWGSARKIIGPTIDIKKEPLRKIDDVGKPIASMLNHFYLIIHALYRATAFSRGKVVEYVKLKSAVGLNKWLKYRMWIGG